jgi:preprotein translocase subunit SecD
MAGSWWARFTLILTLFGIALYVMMPTFLGEDATDRFKAAMAVSEGNDEVGNNIELALEAAVLPRLEKTFGAEWITEHSYYGTAKEDRLEIRYAEAKDLDVINAALADMPGLVAKAGERDGEIWVSVQETGWKRYLPDTKINLGLDLQGGIDLTLIVEVEEAVSSSVSRDVQSVKDSADTMGVVVSDVRKKRGEPIVEVAAGADVSRGDVTEAVRRNGDYIAMSSYEEDGTTWYPYELSATAQTEIELRSVDQALEGLRNRVDVTGVKEPSIVKKGDGINIQLPGMDNLEQAIDVIGTTAVLEFYLVDEEFDTVVLEKALLSAEEALPTKDYEDDSKLNDWLIDEGIVSTDRMVMWEYQARDDGSDRRDTPYVLKSPAMIGGDDINDAFVQWDRLGDPYVSLEFKGPGGKKFGQVTGDNVGKRFAIVLDDKIRSAPVIREKISGGRAQISMGSGVVSSMQGEAQVLSMVLRTGALPAPVTIAEVRTVGAQLGADSVSQGVRGTMVGAGIVLVFMLVYYAKIGIVASIALSMNVVFIMALLAMMGATLTLPGIAGIALTVGMAVDANIIIFERIREELNLGKTARAAVDAGFENGFSAVLDANITTAIAGVVLYSYGTGPIKGFAVTLLIGIATTLFTAVFVSRTFMDFVVRKATTRWAM